MNLFRKFKTFIRYLKKEDKVMREFAIGMSSEVDIRRDLHILFMDYDDVTFDQVRESVLECQEFWFLSDAFIYKTAKGFHVYFFYDIMPYSRVRQIIEFAKYVDDKFRFISRYYDYKTIRQAGKYKVRDIEYYCLIRGSRVPSPYEAEVGDMKRKEREALGKMHDMFNKEALNGGSSGSKN